MTRTDWPEHLVTHGSARWANGKALKSALHEAEDVWQCFEAGDGGWATRRADLRGVDGCPLTAASLAEVPRIRDGADRAAMRDYELRFGVLSETVLDGWRDAPRAEEITQTEFEQVWERARAVLGSA